MKIYFHLGPTKAGSSSLQQFFEGHPEALARAGLYFPSPIPDAGGANYDVKLDVKNGFAALEAMLAECCSRHADLILSSEWGLPQLSALTSVEAGELRALLARYEARLVLILMYRHPIPRHLSDYSQKIANKVRNHERFTEFLDHAELPESPADLVGKIQHVAHMAGAESIDMVMMRRGWEKHVLSHFGMDGVELPAPHTNPRLPDIYVELLRQHNSLAPSPSENIHFAKLLMLVSAKEGFTVPFIIARRAARYNAHHKALPLSYFDRFVYAPNWPLQIDEKGFKIAAQTLRAAWAECD